MARAGPGKEQAAPSTTHAIESALRDRNYAAAVSLSEINNKTNPTPASERVYRQTLLRATRHFADQRQMRAFSDHYAIAERLPADPNWTIELACLQAAGWNYNRGLELIAPLADPAATARVTVTAVDRAVRLQEDSVLPMELRAGCQAILAAFRAYEAKNDEAAKEALQAIGLQSPFLEWKLLLRGLSAYTASDNGRAIENWQRLSPDRVPYRLIAPLRAQLDTEFRSTLSEANQITIDRHSRRLLANDLTGLLKKVPGEFANPKGIDGAFRLAETILPLLKATAPHLLPALGNIFYTAVIRDGAPNHVGKYRTLFGPPPYDPSFDRLQAIAYGHAREDEESLQRWTAYDAWLSKGPKGLPLPQVERVRAIVWQTMGVLATDIAVHHANEEEDELYAFVSKMMKGEKKSPKSKAKKNQSDPSFYFRQAAQLAPDWEDPVAALFGYYMTKENLVEAEAVARKLLESNPDSPKPLVWLGNLFSGQGRMAEALEFRLRSLAISQLDPLNRRNAALAYVGLARKFAIEGNIVQAERTLEKDRPLLDAELPSTDAALRAVIAAKKSRPEESDQLEAFAVQQSGARLSARLQLFVNSVLLKVKPAIKTIVSKAYTSVLTEVPTPEEVLMLHAAWCMFVSEGLTYTGQKTQIAKIYETCSRTAKSSTGTELEFEAVANLLDKEKQYKHLHKLTLELTKQFRKNPLFHLLLAEAEVGKNENQLTSRKVTNSLHRALSAAESSPEQRHHDLIPRIQQFLEESDPSSMMPDFFNFFD